MNNTRIKNSKGSSIIEGLLNESALTELFKSIGSEDIESIKIINTYDCNKEHTGLIVEVNNEITDEIERIIIDAVIGYPVTEQVYETVYKKGSSCDKRIIVYTEGFADLEAYGGMDDDAIKNLVANLNAYGTNIFLVNLVESKNEVSLDYLVIQEPFERPDYKMTELPSEERLKEEEFWDVYYWQQFEDYYPYKSFTGYLHEPLSFGHVYGPDGATLYVKWNEEGLIFKAIDENDESKYLEPIWNNRKHELQVLYPDAEMTFLMKPGKLPKLLIKIWPIPVQHLMDASISEKKRLASEILEGFGKLIDFITSPLNDIVNAKIDEMKESVELA